MAPMSDDLPEREPPDLGSFNDWLAAKGRDKASAA
jgi:hypothetical protein